MNGQLNDELISNLILSCLVLSFLSMIYTYIIQGKTKRKEVRSNVVIDFLTNIYILM